MICKQKFMQKMILLIGALSVASGVYAFQLHNDEYDFTITIPDGFKAYDYLKVHSGTTYDFVKKNTLYAYNLGGSPEKNNYTGLFLDIERSSWLMVNNPAPDNDLSVLKNAWQGLDINLYRQEDGFYKNRATRLTLTAAIPLKAGPVQIKLSGSPAKEDEMKTILKSMLDSLDAEAGLLAGTSKFGYLLVPLGALGFVIYTLRKGS